MAYKITRNAELDLQDIANFIAADNKKAAFNMLKIFEESFLKLSQMPNMGFSKTEWTDKDLKFWSIKKYLIVYKIESNHIVIVRVLSGYRDVVALLD